MFPLKRGILVLHINGHCSFFILIKSFYVILFCAWNCICISTFSGQGSVFTVKDIGPGPGNPAAALVNGQPQSPSFVSPLYYSRHRYIFQPPDPPRWRTNWTVSCSFWSSNGNSKLARAVASVGKRRRGESLVNPWTPTTPPSSPNSHSAAPHLSHIQCQCLTVLLLFIDSFNQIKMILVGPLHCLIHFSNQSRHVLEIWVLFCAVYTVLPPLPIYVFSASQTTLTPLPNKLVPTVLWLLRKQKLRRK